MFLQELLQNELDAVGGKEKVVEKLEYYSNLVPFNDRYHLDITIIVINFSYSLENLPLNEQYLKSSKSIKKRIAVYKNLQEKHNCEVLGAILSFYSKAENYVNSL